MKQPILIASILGGGIALGAIGVAGIQALKPAAPATLAGGLAGNKVQEGMQQRDQVTSTQTICNTENVDKEKVVGYDVRYSLDGKTATVRMDEKPEGKTLPAKDGKLLM